MSWPSEVIIYTDGASRGNPGAASVGVYVIDKNEKVVAEISKRIGIQTNNVAEYSALLFGLLEAKKNNAEKVLVRADSELMVRQMKGEYKVKAEGLKSLFRQCQELAKSFVSIKYEHVPRDANHEADRLANEALDSD